MVRRRTAAVSIAAAGLLLASPALTACGSGPARAGSAAVVGDHRITVSTLESRVKEVRAVEQKAPQGQQSVENSGSLPAQTLNVLVQIRVIAKVARDAGITVTDDEVQRQRDLALQQFGGSRTQLDTALAMQYKIGPSGVDDFFRTNLLVGRLIQKLGFEPGSDPGNAALAARAAAAAKSLGVEINPRYGKWDPAKAVIGSSSDPWVVSKTPLTDQSA